MSHTNSTTNYSLPQFVGTDKPAWLTDINGAFSAIDTAVKNASDAATTAGTNATTANTSIGTLSNLNTTEKTNLVGAVNEVNTGLGTVSGVASEASTKATNAKNTADAIASALNFTKFKHYSADDITKTGATSVSVTDFASASNENGSVGKIYGKISGSCNNSNGFSLSFPTDLRPDSTISIDGVCWGCRFNSSNVVEDPASSITIHIATDGTATVNGSSIWYNKRFSYNFSACILFLKDFGDTGTGD